MRTYLDVPRVVTRWARHFLAAVAGLLFLGLTSTASGAEYTQADYEAGALLLDDGRGFAPFWDAPGDNWTVEAGAIARTRSGGDAYLRRHRLPSRFTLDFEYRGDVGANGGIVYGAAQHIYPIGAQLPGVASACRMAAASSDGRWHRGRILVAADRVEHWADGTLLCVAPADSLAGEEGLFYFRLLDGRGRFAVKNLVFRSPPTAGGEPNAALSRLSSLAARKHAWGELQAFASALNPRPQSATVTFRDLTPLRVSSPRLRLTRLARDEQATYYAYTVPALKGLHGNGLLILPNRISAGARLPLIIAHHGSGHSPEWTLLFGSNYHDMVRGPLREGYAVLAPSKVGASPLEQRFGNDIARRDVDRVSALLRRAGTSLVDVEVARASAALDAVLARYPVDPARIVSIGLSYGGAMTSRMMALDNRVVAGVNAAGFDPFGDTESGYSDLDQLRLIAPRPLLILSGRHDPFTMISADVVESALAVMQSRYGTGGRLEFRATNGGHEFDWPAAKAFLREVLTPQPSRRQ